MPEKVCVYIFLKFVLEILDYVERNLFHMGKPTDSMVALNDKDYFLAGMVMVMSILQGGPSPAFLHPSVFAYLSNGSLSPDDNVNEYKTVALKVKFSFLLLLASLSMFVKYEGIFTSSLKASQVVICFQINITFA